MQPADEQHNGIVALDAHRVAELPARGQLTEPALVNAQPNRCHPGRRGAQRLEHTGFVRRLGDEHPGLSHEPRRVVDQVISAAIGLPDADARCETAERRPDHRDAAAAGRRKRPARMSAA